MEGENVRRAGFNNPIALIPNGVELPAALEKPEIRNQKSAVRRALFLSRIHPKKGLLNLVKAWDAVQKSEARSQKPEVGIPASDFRSPASDKWELLIVGPDEGGHLAEVQAAVRNAGLERQIHFHGEVMGEDKIECYRGADLFVLPSFSENFGLVIAEALSCGVPVITTRETPWEELETHRFG
jgi:glycosyltransferase involved in cell wall biosynthesis